MISTVVFNSSTTISFLPSEVTISLITISSFPALALSLTLTLIFIISSETLLPVLCIAINSPVSLLNFISSQLLSGSKSLSDTSSNTFLSYSKVAL